MESYTRRDIRIPVRDGRELVGDVYLPESGGGPWPAVLVQTPYGKERLGAALPHPSARSWLDYWDRESYALVIVDWRGYYASKEEGEDPPPPHRGRDGFDLVEWVARQPWCDRKVAGWGPSALGRAVLRTSSAKPPHLLCGVPLVCHMGHHYEDFHEGGVLQEAHVDAIRALGFHLVPEILREPFSGTDFYRAGEKESRPERIDLPLFFITGWFDLNVDRTLRFFERLRRRGGARSRAYSKLMVGPWHHTAIDQPRQGQLKFPGAAGGAGEATRKFFDHWLRGNRESGWREQARVLYWQMGEERWVESESWPPPGLTERAWHLDAGGRIRREPPGSVEVRQIEVDPTDPVPTVGGANLPLGLGAGPYDQRKIEERHDVVVFSTDPLDEPVSLCGRARLRLTVSVDRPDADVTMRLTDVHPDGRSYLVCDTAMRLKLREGTDKPRPVAPGERCTVELTLPPTAITFLEEHRIRVSVSGTNHPRYERNTHTGADRFDEESAVPAELTFHFGGEAEASLILPSVG